VFCVAKKVLCVGTHFNNHSDFTIIIISAYSEGVGVPERVFGVGAQLVISNHRDLSHIQRYHIIIIINVIE
jgi:hypothetical protein